MPVKTKSVYEPAAPGDGVRVLVTRYYPRGMRKDRFDQWVKSLSPSRELLSSYRGGKKSWGEFKESFLGELKASPESLEALRTLAAMSRVQAVTLLCYEKAGLPCHRHVVRDVLTTPGLLSKDVRAEDAGRPLRSSKTRRRPEAPSTKIRF